MTIDVDAVIAGGGVAGSAAAAALAALGWSVLIVEPGQHDDRRLAGELIHPAGVAGLAELGLLRVPEFAAAARLDGFAIFPETGLLDCMELPYRHAGATPAVALALDHASICHGLLANVAALPSVSVARSWRVIGLAGTDAEPIVQLRHAGVTETVRCRMVVAADGASSPVRAHAGLRHRRTRNAVLTGYLVDRAVLPLPGHAHVFTAAGGPVLAYAIGEDRARVLFNRRLAPAVPSGPRPTPPSRRCQPRCAQRWRPQWASATGATSSAATSRSPAWHAVLSSWSATPREPATRSVPAA